MNLSALTRVRSGEDLMSIISSRRINAIQDAIKMLANRLPDSNQHQSDWDEGDAAQTFEWIHYDLTDAIVRNPYAMDTANNEQGVEIPTAVTKDEDDGFVRDLDESDPVSILEEMEELNVHGPQFVKLTKDKENNQYYFEFLMPGQYEVIIETESEVEMDGVDEAAILKWPVIGKDPFIGPIVNEGMILEVVNPSSSSAMGIHQIDTLTVRENWGSRKYLTETYFSEEDATPQPGEFIVAKDGFGTWVYVIAEKDEDLELHVSAFDFEVNDQEYTALLLDTPKSFEGEVSEGHTNKIHSVQNVTNGSVSTDARRVNDLEVNETINVPVHLILYDAVDEDGIGWEWIFLAPLNGYRDIAITVCDDGSPVTYEFLGK